MGTHGQHCSLLAVTLLLWDNLTKALETCSTSSCACERALAGKVCAETAINCVVKCTWLANLVPSIGFKWTDKPLPTLLTLVSLEKDSRSSLSRVSNPTDRPCCPRNSCSAF